MSPNTKRYLYHLGVALCAWLFVCLAHKFLPDSWLALLTACAVVAGTAYVLLKGSNDGN